MSCFPIYLSYSLDIYNNSLFTLSLLVPLITLFHIGCQEIIGFYVAALETRQEQKYNKTVHRDN